MLVSVAADNVSVRSWAVDCRGKDQTSVRTDASLSQQEKAGSPADPMQPSGAVNFSPHGDADS